MSDHGWVILCWLGIYLGIGIALGELYYSRARSLPELAGVPDKILTVVSVLFGVFWLPILSIAFTVLVVVRVRHHQ